MLNKRVAGMPSLQPHTTIVSVSAARVIPV